jgi:hypothetical protein
VASDAELVTFVWFIIWFAANSIGDAAPLRFDPVNIWAGTLLLAIALDLARTHAPSGAKRRGASHGG